MAARVALVSLLALAFPAVADAQLTVYSSLPLQGTSRDQSMAVVRGARLALEEAGGGAGGFSVRYVSLDDSTRQNPGTGDVVREVLNARRAVMDDATIAYIGAFNSGASKISMPILNVAGILQVSPSNTYIGLTRGGPGTERGEPRGFRPSGRRTYVRIIPNDRVQADSLVLTMKEDRCRRVFVIHDRTIYGFGMGTLVRRFAQRRGVRVIGRRVMRSRARSYRGIARVVRRRRATCVALGSTTGEGAVGLVTDVGRRSRRVRFYAVDGVAELGFTDPRRGGIPRSIGRRTHIMVQTPGISAFPPLGQAFFDRYAARFHVRTDPYAAYGFEAMGLVLDAIARGGGTQAGVVSAAFATRNRESVLGTYSIDAAGDTTLRTYGVYRIRRGFLVFDRVVNP